MQDLREEYTKRESDTVIIAPHGYIERKTETLATLIADQLQASIYKLLPTDQSSAKFQELHIPSTEMPKDWMIKLKQAIANHKLGISIHGHNHGLNKILVGGANIPEGFVEQLRSRLPEIKILSPDKSPEELNGDDQDNFINKFEVGIQLEVSRDLRQDQQKIVRVAQAVVESLHNS